MCISSVSIEWWHMNQKGREEFLSWWIIFLVIVRNGLIKCCVHMVCGLPIILCNKSSVLSGSWADNKGHQSGFVCCCGVCLKNQSSALQITLTGPPPCLFLPPNFSSSVVSNVMLFLEETLVAYGRLVQALVRLMSLCCLVSEWSTCMLSCCDGMKKKWSKTLPTQKPFQNWQ